MAKWGAPFGWSRAQWATFAVGGLLVFVAVPLIGWRLGWTVTGIGNAVVWTSGIVALFYALLDWLDMHNGAVVAIATVVGAIIAGIYAFVTWGMWRESHRQAEASVAAARAANEQADVTRRIFEASHRPYVAIMSRDPLSLPDGRLQFSFSLENKGAAPAVVTAWRVAVRMGSKPIIEQIYAEDKIASVAFAGETASMPHIEISATQAAPMKGSGNPVLVEVRVAYRGVTERGYSTSLVMEFMSIADRVMWRRRSIQLE